MAYNQKKWSGWNSPYKKWAFSGKVHKSGHGDLIQAERNKHKKYIEDVPVSQQNWIQRRLHDPTKQKSFFNKIFSGKRKNGSYKAGLGDMRIFGGRGVRNMKQAGIIKS